MIDWKQGKGAKLYRHAQRRIPGGTQLLSKRPEMFLPEQWPAYYSRAKGCEIWDLDGRRLVDMTTGGIGTCPLGYADDEVNAAVKAAIDAGSMCTLNPSAEVELADLLCRIHPWATMARFARCGGEAMAVAVRIARAFTGRDKVAICGYHGWQDWYLAANLADDKNLDGHLLAGLEPRGVPRGLLGSALPFRYNRIEELEAIVARHGRELAAVVMEPIRWDMPRDNFLQRVKDVAARAGAVLVFDEITIGWRMVVGGSHLLLNVQPDMAVYAKAMSNGFPMAAIIGTEPVMQAAQTSFISSTYWTEAIGPTAAVATISKMQRINLPKVLAEIGTSVLEGCRRLADKHGVKLNAGGQPALCHFGLDYGDDSQAILTLLTQEMLDRGYLTSAAFYPTITHKPAIIDEYLGALDGALAKVKDAIDKKKVQQLLRGPVAHKGFRRLN